MSINALARFQNTAASVSPSRSIRRPDSTSEYVFLDRVQDAIGEVMFADQWTGDEPRTTLPPVLPDCRDAAIRNGLLANLDPIDESVEVATFFAEPTYDVLEYAENLLRTERPDLNANSLNALLLATSLLGSVRTFTVKEWRIAQYLAAHQRIIALEACRRWRQIMIKIKDLCEEGILVTVTRGLEGGDWSEVLPRAHWRFEEYVSRFVTGQYTPSQPFKVLLDHPENRWIFVSIKSLEAALLKLSAKRTVAAPGIQPSFVSDQIAFALRVAKECGVTAENHQNKLSIEAHIRASWPWDDEPSHNEVKWIATLARNRSAKGGKNQAK